MDNLKHTILTAFPSFPAFVFAVEAPSKFTIITSIILPIVFFIISKSVDVLLQLYLKRKK